MKGWKIVGKGGMAKNNKKKGDKKAFYDEIPFASVAYLEIGCGVIKHDIPYLRNHDVGHLQLQIGGFEYKRQLCVKHIKTL